MHNRINRFNYRCPRCNSQDILEFEDFFSCNKCNLVWYKVILGEIDIENILARQELKGMCDAFNDEDYGDITPFPRIPPNSPGPVGGVVIQEKIADKKKE